MRSRPRELRRAIAALALLIGVACDRAGSDAASDTGPPADPDTTRALDVADPELYATCDSIETSVRAVMRRGAQRHNGGYTGSATGATRYGCRITASDTVAPDQPRPLETVWQSLAARGWTLEQSFMADGPEGSMLGLRSGSRLCVLAHSWQAGSDDERATRPDVAVPYEVAVECFRAATSETSG